MVFGCWRLGSISISLLPEFLGDKSEDRVHAAPAGPIHCDLHAFQNSSIVSWGRHPLNRAKDAAGVPPNLLGEGTQHDDVVDSFRFLVTEEAQVVCLQSMPLSSISHPMSLPDRQP
jgi:hypothetical protein